MEIKTEIARVRKTGMEYSSDGIMTVERPGGGIRVILADGQGNGLESRLLSRMAVNYAASLVAEGKTNEEAMRAINDRIYEEHERKVPCSLMILSVDTGSGMIEICRNTPCPVMVSAQEYDALYDDSSNPAGIDRHMHTETYSLPIDEENGMLIAGFTDGFFKAGHKHSGRGVNIDDVWKIIHANPIDDCGYIAKSILEYAIDLDGGEPADDMTVAVLAVVPAEHEQKVETIAISYPY